MGPTELPTITITITTGKPDAIASQQGAGDPVQNSGRSYNESTEVV
jgi:hypothetical protein